ALMRPAYTAPAPRHMVIIVDASGSMLTADGGASRFEHARSEARKLASAMHSEDRATLLRAGASVTTTCSACKRSDLEHALSAIRPGAARADISQALSVAAGL